MKKFFYSALILVGLLVNSPGIFAADPLGTCNTSNYKTQEFKVYADKTKAACDAMKTVDVEVEWIPNDAPLGTCTEQLGPNEQGPVRPPITNISQTDCQAKGTNWKWTPNGSGPPGQNTTYQLLSPLPCDPDQNIPGCTAEGLSTFDTAGAAGKTTNLGLYLNTMLRIFIGICAVLAVIMIVVGGLQYMTSELVTNKEEGKSRIKHAILGLILALGAYTILWQINPKLLDTDLKTLTNAEVTVQIDLGGEGSAPFTALTPQALQAIGITCNGGGSANLVATAQSFVGRSVYDRDQRNSISGGKAHVDCSSYVSQVYSCVGLGNPGGTTTGIFGSGGTPVTSISADGTKVNGNNLQVGDLLGWRQGENGEKWGHVVMYIGNGQVIDAQRSGVAPRALNSEQFKGRIKYINRISAGATGGW